MAAKKKTKESDGAGVDPRFAPGVEASPKTDPSFVVEGRIHREAPKEA